MNAASPAASDVRVVPAGDAALVVGFEARIDPLVTARVVALADAIRLAAPDGVRDVVPRYRSVTVCVDPLRTAADDRSSRLARGAARMAQERALMSVEDMWSR